MLKDLPPGEYHSPWGTGHAGPLLVALANAVEAGWAAEMTMIERTAALAFEPDIRQLVGDGPMDAFRAAIIKSPSAVVHRSKPEEQTAPVQRDGWRDQDELTRAEVAARLGTTERYFRTQFEAGRVRGKRYSRKTIKYIWGEVREDWDKLATE